MSARPWSSFERMAAVACVAEAITDMPGMPAQPKVPVWVSDDRWDAWHAWLPQDVMTREGRALTACGDAWYWSATVTASYQILAEAGCSNCLAVITTGLPYKRGRGARRRLPQGPLPPRTPGRPGRPRKVLDSVSTPETPGSGAKTRTEKLLEVGATPVTYTRPDGQVVTTAKGTLAQRQALDTEDVELEFTFEVGTRLPAWECIECGQVLAFGDRFCSTWCTREHRRQVEEDRRDRDGVIMARRQFHDLLYGVPRRDSIRSWTPPVSQIRRRQWSP
jgi:predicted nucleic acid-binding Zn ribbon protein